MPSTPERHFSRPSTLGRVQVNPRVINPKCVSGNCVATLGGYSRDNCRAASLPTMCVLAMDAGGFSRNGVRTPNLIRLISHIAFHACI